MSNTTSSINKELSESTLQNLQEIESEIETSSQYFKPQPGKTYMVEVDLDKHNIVPIENEHFKDAQGKPLRRYEIVVIHVNNGREQKWTISKTLMTQIIAELRKGLCFEGERHGTDRTTTYDIEGIY